MNSKEQARFDKLYQQHLTEHKLQGLAPKTVEAFPRGPQNSRLFRLLPGPSVF